MRFIDRTEPPASQTLRRIAHEKRREGKTSDAETLDLCASWIANVAADDRRRKEDR